MLNRLVALSCRFFQAEDGPTAVEYAVILAVVVASCIGIVTTLGHTNSKTYKHIRKAVRTATSS